MVPAEAPAVQVLADNERALRFYGRLGFKKVGTAKRHVRLKAGFRNVVYLEKFLQLAGLAPSRTTSADGPRTSHTSPSHDSSTTP